ncbi:MAG: ABC transporter substrate-binding protein, partial [Chloroflexota bacterium]|nr:ABC transporter substrate-binding protein [Chloroflexota bacterium]
MAEALTGGYAQGSKDNLDAFNLYLDSIGDTVAGRRIEAISADTLGQAEAAATKARQLVQNDKVQILAGAQYTPECYAIAAYAKEARVPFVASGSCGSQDVMTNPKFASPYIVRTTQVPTQIGGALADYLVKHGMTKLILVASNYAAGVQVGDFLAATYVEKGGSIAQEIHPPLGTSDMGPYLAQLSPAANSLFLFAPGNDGLHFMQQLSNYVPADRKLNILDWGGTVSSYVDQLKDKAVGVIQVGPFTPVVDTPQANALKSAWNKKYPGRALTFDAAEGWGGAQFIAQAIKDANGRVEDTENFLKVLYKTKVDSARGPLSLDAQHDVVQNIYVSEIVKQGSGFTQKLLATYPEVSRTTFLSADQIQRLSTATLKGKWVGMTKAKLDAY